MNEIQETTTPEPGKLVECTFCGRNLPEAEMVKITIPLRWQGTLIYRQWVFCSLSCAVDYKMAREG